MTIKSTERRPHVHVPYFSPPLFSTIANHNAACNIYLTPQVGLWKKHRELCRMLFHSEAQGNQTSHINDIIPVI